MTFCLLYATGIELFEPLIGRYNDASGKVRARVNLGKVMPPSRKLNVPLYDRNNLDLLQELFDWLEQQGVFARPEDINVVVEHVSPSFLVKKKSGGYRKLVPIAIHIHPYLYWIFIELMDKMALDQPSADQSRKNCDLQFFFVICDSWWKHHI